MQMEAGTSEGHGPLTVSPEPFEFSLLIKNTMRLLNTLTIRVQEFPGPELAGCPPYSIVSHTWEKDEVTLQEVQTPTLAVIKKAGYEKVLSCAAKAKSDGYQYVWIDTCW